MRIRKQKNSMTDAETPSFSVPLGHPLPLDEHACSVSLPTWCSVVGYEEGDPDVTSQMGCGYPRFVYHPYLLKLMELSLELDQNMNKEKKFSNSHNTDCIILPGKFSANRARDFMIRALNMDDNIPLSSKDNAIDSFDDTEDSNNYPIRVLKLPTQTVEVYALIFPAITNAAIQAKSYWQHTGEVVSSRRAEIALLELDVSPEEIKRVTPDIIDAQSKTVEVEGSRTCPTTNKTYSCLHTSCSSGNDKVEVKERISSIVSQQPSSVFLAPSGMAAIYQALRSARRRCLSTNDSNKHPSASSGGTVIVYGFPYLDTLKMCGRPELVPSGVEFFGCGDNSDLLHLEELLEARAATNSSGDAGICALITEFPSNPLLNCHDLENLRRLANKYDFALIIDDTISCFSNVDLLNSGIADVVCTSLTKLFNGRGDAMAGSLVVNEKTKIGKWMKNDMTEYYEGIGEEDTLFASDIAAVNINSEDFLERSHIINHNSEKLADWFSEHPDVQEIYYPKFSQPDLYNRYLKDATPIHTSGYGGLLAILLEPHICQRTFYDKLPLSKGPSLGTNFTLICPYTLLAHYHELEFARTYNVSPNLIRIAVGLEDFEEVKEKFVYAFDQGRLHPKLKPLQTGKSNSDQIRAYSTNPLWKTSNCARFSNLVGGTAKSGYSRKASFVPRRTHNCRIGNGLFGSLMLNGLVQSLQFGWSR